MKYDFNLDGVLNYDGADLDLPDTIIAEMSQQLTQSTNGYIKGIVKEYSGHIESYDQMSGFAAIAATLGTSITRRDIQQELGAIGYKTFKFEFYLTSSELDNYKYRLFFFEYGISSFPVKIILEQGIADEIFNEENADYIIEYSTQKELENFVTNILKTRTVIKVMQDLIYATQRIIKLASENQKLIDDTDMQKG